MKKKKKSLRIQIQTQNLQKLTNAPSTQYPETNKNASVFQTKFIRNCSSRLEIEIFSSDSIQFQSWQS